MEEREKSTVDTIMILIHNIQLAKQNKKDLLALFINVKGSFDHVSVNQLIKICIKLVLRSDQISV